MLTAGLQRHRIPCAPSLSGPMKPKLRHQLGLVARNAHPANPGRSPARANPAKCNPVVAKTAIDGGWLIEEEFFRLMQWLRTADVLRPVPTQRQQRFPLLAALAGLEHRGRSLVPVIEKYINANGHLYPNATPELARLRRALQDRTTELRKVVNRQMRHAAENGWTDAEDITLKRWPTGDSPKGRIPQKPTAWLSPTP